MDGQGQILTFTDRDGTTHRYSYDPLGRVTMDTMTTLGSGVNGSVMAIGTQYDAQGNPYLVTSYNGNSSGSIVNQVEDLYNDFGQLLQEYQAVDGAITSSTPSVQYSYDDLGWGGGPALTSIEYPDGYTVDYNVDTISRLSSISDFTGTLQSYTYMGVDTVVDLDDNQAGVALNYVNSMSTGDAGDEVVGLDRYGRVVSQNWQETSGDTTTTVAGDAYTYDNDGNVLTKDDLVTSALDQTFGYDGLNQITSYSQSGGTVDSNSIASQSQAWTYDALGNMTDVSTDGTSQSRTVNAQNEYTSISGASATPGYDTNGNMTADQNGLHYVYNAWNELVDVYNSSSETSATLVESMTYDGMGRLVTDTVYTDETGATTIRYYSNQDQVIEEQEASSSEVICGTRYVWSPVYVNAMVLRDTATSGDSLTYDSSGSQRIYSLYDADYNVVALVNTSGSVVERDVYTPFGVQTIYSSTYTLLGSSAYTWAYGFQGMRFDTLTMLNEADERWYSAALGRWTAKDPLGFAAGQANLYEIEGNGPIDHLDPSGLWGGIISFIQNSPKITKVPSGNGKGSLYRFEWNYQANKECGCNHVSFIQVAKSTIDGKPLYTNDITAEQSLMTGNHFLVDKDPRYPSPYYGAIVAGERVENDRPHGYPGSATTPANMVDEPGRLGILEGNKPGMTIQVKFGDGNIEKIFEVFAVCIDTGKILAGFTWGIKIPKANTNNDDVELIGLQFRKRPTDNWWDAVEQYNTVAQKKNPIWSQFKGKRPIIERE